MLIECNTIELPKIKKQYYRLNKIPNLNLENSFNPAWTICSNQVVQVVLGILYNSNYLGLHSEIYYSKGISVIEALNDPTTKALFHLCNNNYILENTRGKVVGIRVSVPTQDALNTYIMLSKENMLDNCVKEVFKKHDIKCTLPEWNFSILKMEDDKKEDEWVLLPQIVRNALYSYLLAESFRNRKRAAISLFDWKKDEIENSLYLNGLLKFFRNVYFEGFDDGKSGWTSNALIVSEPYEYMNSLDDIKHF